MGLLDRQAVLGEVKYNPEIFGTVFDPKAKMKLVKPAAGRLAPLRPCLEDSRFQEKFLFDVSQNFY